MEGVVTAQEIDTLRAEFSKACSTSTPALTNEADSRHGSFPLIGLRKGPCVMRARLAGIHSTT